MRREVRHEDTEFSRWLRMRMAELRMEFDQDLAALVGVTPVTVGRWRNNVNQPTELQLPRLAQALGVEVDDIKALLAGLELLPPDVRWMAKQLDSLPPDARAEAMAWLASFVSQRQRARAGDQARAIRQGAGA